MWKWNTVCQAAGRQAFRMLKPSGSSVSSIRFASRRAAIIVASRSSSAISIRSAEWARGTTRAWPRVAGLMSMNATVRSSESRIWPGMSPATMPQNRQSFIGRGAYCVLFERLARQRHGVVADR